MIPVLGMATLSRHDLAERMLASIDYPIEHLVIVNNSGKQNWEPPRVAHAKHQWHIQVPYGLGLVGAWNLVIKSTPHAAGWLLVNDDAHFLPGSLAKIDKHRNNEALNFLDIVPPWSAVYVGEQVVLKAGLIDEAFYPLYFDDNDWQRRIENAGIPIVSIDATVLHDNSATLKSGYEKRNATTFAANQRRYNQKIATGDFSVHGWDLSIRRAQSWE